MFETLKVLWKRKRSLLPNDSLFKHYDNLAADLEAVLCLCVFASLHLWVLMCVYGFTGCHERVQRGSCCWPSALQLSPRRLHERGGGLHQPLHYTAPDANSCGAYSFTPRPHAYLSCFVKIAGAFDHRFKLTKPWKSSVQYWYLLLWLVHILQRFKRSWSWFLRIFSKLHTL